MIELEAEILRGSCTPVFFVGETIECRVKFKCFTKKDKFSSNSKNFFTSNEVDQQSPSALASSNTDNSINNHDEHKPDELRSNNKNNNNQINEINESMFSMLSTMSLNSSSQSASLPISSASIQPSDKVPQKTTSFFSFDRSSSKETHQNDIDQNEQIIAWSCAQIDCHCFIDESKVNLPKDPLRYNFNNDNKVNEIANTSFQPNKDRIGMSVYSSKPKILFCNLSLRPNQSKSFIFKEKIPYDLPPTFRGQFAKYTYKLTIGVQKLNKSTQLLRLPFRVFSLLDFERYIPRNNFFVYDYNSSIHINNSLKRSSNQTLSDKLSNSDSFEMVPSVELENPFKIEEKSEYENLEYALQIIEDLTAPITTNNYNVTSPDGKIVKITLNRTNYKVGDKIVAFLDFTDAQVSCVEYKVTLQSEEIIAEECRKKSNQNQSSIHSHTELKEFSLFLNKADFTLQIPVHLTPTFVSDIISLRWRLHFDFALSKTHMQKIQKSNDSAMSVSWHPPSYLTVEVISWDLPIVIHPFDPFVASDLIYSNNQSSEKHNLILP